MNSPASKSVSKDFLRRLTRLKKDLDLESNKALAQLIGQPDSTVRGWMRGERPSVEKIESVEIKLKIRMEKIAKESQAIHNFLPLEAC